MTPEDVLARRQAACLETLPSYISEKIKVVDGHWLWPDCDVKGYSKTITRWLPDGTTKIRHAHQIVYEILVRVVPSPLELDHTCVYKNCVHPACLDEVTHAENQRRGSWRQLHCRKRGHLFTPENTLRLRTGKTCRQCVHEAAHRRAIRKAEREGRVFGEQRCGEKVHLAKLTEAKVREIRRLHADGNISIRQLGRDFGVSGNTIGNVIHGITWRHVS